MDLLCGPARPPIIRPSRPLSTNDDKHNRSDRIVGQARASTAGAEAVLALQLTMVLMVLNNRGYTS